MTDIKLDRSAIERHAAHLRTASSQTYDAHATAAGINLGDGSFGLMCSFLPPIINACHPDHLGVISSAAGLLSATADALEAALDEVGATDEQVATTMNRIESRLGGAS
ncbi:hypothetical protein P5P86_05370 [Nocardioides sp. BP30]|uniref:hypothetical protein n=1 Tax=Nocardioides sp. BP30 TaxID=3036374 RepID=UPI0024685B10|nr:hypothetical protein [Nocardioides sp. BP30]WGL53255.1 hypothetical protein P5P86_05370 [Nocardioides sp. BP30]